ncbi:DUF4249 family protein [Flexithrix dorotheae]|uniref:DUF4249 family protein n=1 Tax=Flexithrix dorotheae TaxID=70993 RepID=UPI00036E5329|nr:DUF4249 family protein [Flexithrix dorotheae]
MLHKNKNTGKSLSVILSWISVLALLCFLSSCDPEEPDFGDLEKVVIEGYLFADQPVENILVKRLDNQEPISDADVAIFSNDSIFLLSPTPNRPGRYHFEGNELNIRQGNEYTIIVNYFDKTAFGSTIVPPPPINLRQDKFVIKAGVPSNPDSVIDQEYFLGLAWENQNATNYFFLEIYNIEENPEEIDFGEDFERPQNFLFPVNNNFAIIQDTDLQYYGNHLVKLYRVNPEYVSLYFEIVSENNQGTPSVESSPSNIQNGAGIFTAFNCSITGFQAVRD